MTLSIAMMLKVAPTDDDTSGQMRTDLRKSCESTMHSRFRFISPLYIPYGFSLSPTTSRTHSLKHADTGTSLYDNPMLPQLQSEILKSTGTDSLPLALLMCLRVHVMSVPAEDSLHIHQKARENEQSSTD